MRISKITTSTRHFLLERRSHPCPPRLVRSLIGAFATIDSQRWPDKEWTMNLVFSQTEWTLRQEMARTLANVAQDSTTQQWAQVEYVEIAKRVSLFQQDFYARKLPDAPHLTKYAIYNNYNPLCAWQTFLSGNTDSLSPAHLSNLWTTLPMPTLAPHQQQVFKDLFFARRLLQDCPVHPTYHLIQELPTRTPTYALALILALKAPYYNLHNFIHLAPLSDFIRSIWVPHVPLKEVIDMRNRLVALQTPALSFTHFPNYACGASIFFGSTSSSNFSSVR